MFVTGQVQPTPAIDTSTLSNTTFAINFSASITLTSDLYAVNPKNANSLVSSGDNGSGGSYSLDGNNQYRGLLVTAGTVTIQNLIIANAVATGGAGGQAQAAGGGGAGLGGGLFVNSGAALDKSFADLGDSSKTGGALAKLFKQRMDDTTGLRATSNLFLLGLTYQR